MAGAGWRQARRGQALRTGVGNDAPRRAAREARQGSAQRDLQPLERGDPAQSSGVSSPGRDDRPRVEASTGSRPKQSTVQRGARKRLLM